MFYPNYLNKTYKKEISYKNRGMDLEYIIDKANKYYEDNDIAFIYKKPTPIKVVKVQYNNLGKRITDAFYECPSTLDFNGIYKGFYIEFDAKVTKEKSFPISNVSNHQIKHIRNIYRHKGIVFLIISINDLYYILDGKDFLYFLDNEKRKSIPYEYINDKGIKINLSLNGLDYIKGVDILLQGGKI